ncbi:1-(5-phosphoribosyl)-5-[(5-phosphoribosylamino)methylideneamino]imidazole-4-carboxamide isomerase [Candidatus Peregrinibacteria bacterium CG22_combo_CG10-13_8_21_14_all_44_10]|nr:MAG: 1-(5-phosphoribosyl)-5-[(5-phosphoribosylamino)methylideneamino]imidazole-4-carboxamide isomerase [Candidatus Peregrinibacteria bacterium CG2_30_44_17]PIP65971.1 MAG: 1-(5-phosphoribosyl)-5-[(5-phosphoribosylamino)methylideneamino]imidazole-4-carboxamide isomerase [Candidatus Peregrinibacteria bacterium CG22_combo_CG10-13_8_21_14_all_44_10]PIS04530.1 MAG: 1-(5-phosphoribosyl)-5-[(5-phosphoribosylamino)methylideneamino]imidazole-4-carboxamide isomerase [Candidatus Peregrinibacteria bacteri
MKIYPAIDIIDGKCVRLTRGEYDNVQKYNLDPLEVARTFQNDGAGMVHVVDLDGAKQGLPVNFDTISRIDVPKQVGGGIRTYNDAKMLLDSGAERIIMSTAAVDDTSLIQRIISDFGDNRIVISLDIKDGLIAIRGWRETSDISIEDFLQRMRLVGIRTLIVTDISRDGMLAGVNTDAVSQFLNKGFEIIVAGGVSSIDDIKQLRELGANGAIIGKALYEGTLTLKQALSC